MECGDVYSGVKAGALISRRWEFDPRVLLRGGGSLSGFNVKDRLNIGKRAAARLQARREIAGDGFGGGEVRTR